MYMYWTLYGQISSSQSKAGGERKVEELRFGDHEGRGVGMTNGGRWPIKPKP